MKLLFILYFFTNQVSLEKPAEPKEEEESTYKVAMLLLDQSKEKEKFNLGELIISADTLTMVKGSIPHSILFKE